MTKTDMLTEEQIAEIQARADKATEAPWANLGEAIWSRGPTCRFQIPHNQADREFTAHAREDIPALCQTVRALREENERLGKHVADINHDFEAANKHCEEYHQS